ncbi:DUF3122 domain-containing protein [Phormidium sp. CLA17]|uniref:DUF3122 domain-containing protein n=1 Tax=Leptolyngbya sp. Cla-17 TaxID=2803751 RepID=UPI001492562A|nr:DUF3122 domain-containing protein [Leptolyngbya sp. Cla-17]MBM0743617.1 DUF3122 domain-containing protein [Leptolyngbya sp. Cla-17]
MKSRARQFLQMICVLSLLLSFSPPAIASVHTYPESDNYTMFRSLQTLRDQSDRAWQFVLFKRVHGGQVESIHLRVVGFPGSGELEHPADLQITSPQQTWMATDTLPQISPFPTNVGEYDALDVVTGLTSDAPLKLELPAVKSKVAIAVPPFVVKEWRRVAAMWQNP